MDLNRTTIVDPKDNITGISKKIEFSESQSISENKGFLNKYNGAGYKLDIKLDFTDKDFFKNTYKKEIMDRNWTADASTLAIIIQFNIYNPNLQML